MVTAEGASSSPGRVPALRLTGTNSFVKRTRRTLRFDPVSILLSAAVALSPFLVWRIPGAFFTVSDGLIVIAGFVWVVRGAMGAKRGPGGSRAELVWTFGVGLLVFSLGLFSVWNGDASRGLLVVGQYGFALGLLPVLASRLGGDRIEVLIRWYLVGTGVVAGYGVLAYYLAPDLPWVNWVGGRVGSLLENPNHLSKAIAVAFPFLLRWGYVELRSLPLVLLLAALFVGGLLVSSSFGGLLAAVFSIGLFLVLSGQVRAAVLILVAAGCAAFIFFASGIEAPEIFVTRVMPLLDSRQALNDAGSFNEKVALATQAWDNIGRNPLSGMGADMFEKISITRVPVHNTYLLLWVEGGIGALVGFMMAMVAALMLCLKAWRSGDRILGASCVATVSGFLFVSLTNTHVYGRFWVVPVVLSGVACSALEKRKSDVGAEPRVHRR